MNKSYLTEVFGAQEGFVYEYTGTVPEGINPESAEMSEHVTLDFLAGHGDNLIATRVVQFPYQHNKILLYAKTDMDMNTSSEFALISHLVPDVIVAPVEVQQPTETSETTETAETTEPSTDSNEQGQ